MRCSTRIDTAGMHEIPARVAQWVEDNPYASRDALLAFLIEKLGIPDSDAVSVVWELAEKIEATLPPISKVELFLTEECNLACPYCFVEGKGPGKKMPREVAENGIRLAISTWREPVEKFQVTFFGGEPFLAFEEMKSSVDFCEQLGLEHGFKVFFNVTTNGTVLTNEMMAYCSNKRIKILLSIDGTREAHDSSRVFRNGGPTWEKIMKVVPRLKRHQPWLGSRMTVAPENVDQLFRGVLTLYSKGINQIILGPATGVRWTASQLKSWKEQLSLTLEWRDRLPTQMKRVFVLTGWDKEKTNMTHCWGCRAGRDTLSITADGRVFPCSKMAGVDGGNGVMPIGTVSSGFAHPFAREVLSGLRPAARTKCRSCRLASQCGGGCYATNYQATGDAFVSGDTDCEFVKAGVELREERRTRRVLAYHGNTRATESR